MTPHDFTFLKDLIYKRSGLVMSQEKVYLLETRLIPLARLRKLSGLDELITKARAGNDETLLRQVTEAMTTNETFFFRDTKPFDQFKKVVLPQLLKERAGRKTLRIWSAACSTGQEAYSLAMILKEAGATIDGWRIDIVGTDLASNVLEKARVGLYSQFEVQRGLPVQLMMKYFTRNNETWQINTALRAMVKFEELNLLKDFSHLRQFDVVFCRNVLIYFDPPTKGDVLQRIRKLMPLDGSLFLGGAETVIGVTDAFKPVANHRGLYQPT